MKKFIYTISVVISSIVLVSCVECKAADDNVWPYQAKLHQPVEVVSYDVSNGKFKVITYKGHEYIVWESKGGSSICHSESCTCKNKH